MDLLIKDGFVYDPLNGINGEKVDICISNGKIVEQCAQDAKVINAANKIVMPGGIDIHTHVAGSNLTSGRGLRPEDMRLGIKPATTFLRAESGNTMPNTFATGHRYIEMGYTMICQPGMPPIKGRETHEELSDIPFVDKTAMTLCEKNWFILRYFREKQFEEAKNFLAWLLWATKGSATKLVNPGGTEAWGFGKNVKSLDDVVPHFDITPREIITGFQRINEELGLHHSIHLHLNQLGKPGNFQIALDTFRALEDIAPPSHLSRTQSAHITHVQFSAFGGTSWRDFCSAADSIAEYINHHDHLTIDSGAVVFGPATTLTADGPVQYDIGNLTRLKWANSDVELETGAGIVPFVYDPKSLTSSIQWAIGIELYLLIKDPWKIMMSTDHPNGGIFTDYPKIIAWLMSKKFRDVAIDKSHKRLPDRSIIQDLDREYTFEEIAIISRALCAKCYSLDQKGHLGVGADADVAVYDFDPKKQDPSEDYTSLISAFRYADTTVKSGKIVVRNGMITAPFQGQTYWFNCPHEHPDIDEFFSSYYSVSMNNYAIDTRYISNPVEVSIKGAA